MKMNFDLEEPFEFLKRTGEVYTIRRTYRRKVRGGAVKAIGRQSVKIYYKDLPTGIRGTRILVKENVGFSDIKNYYLLSGFSSPEEWWNKALELHETSEGLSLYRVLRVGGYIAKSYRCALCNITIRNPRDAGIHVASKHGHNLRGGLKKGILVEL